MAEESVAAHVGVLIVGAGQAAVQLVSALRDGGYEGAIAIVGEEPHLPYQRPPLSKGFLFGEVSVDALQYRAANYFAENDVAMLLGESVVRVERTSAGATVTTSQGRTYTCERLVLATGAVPRRLGLPGFESAGVVTLRNVADGTALGDRLETVRDVVVIGGGFIGLEVASSAMKRGCRVTVLESAPRLLGRAVGQQTSAHILAAIRHQGIEVELDARITRLKTTESGEPTAVELEDGRLVPAQIVVLGIGVTPRTDLAEQMGLAVEDGIVVDEHSLTSDGWTLAIGDCANLPNPYPIDPDLARVRLESVNNAVDQASSAAATILGTPAPYRTVPWFWSDLGDVKLQIAGLSGGHDEVVVRGEPSSGKVAFLYLRQGRLIAADCVNSPADFAAVRRALAGEVVVEPDRLADTSEKLVSILRSAERAPQGVPE